MIDKNTGMSARERMGEEIATLAARIDAATYQLLVLIRRFDEEGGWDCGFLSCAGWLTWRIGLSPNAARERVRVARALADLPLISAAMERGDGAGRTLVLEGQGIDPRRAARHGRGSG